MNKHEETLGHEKSYSCKCHLDVLLTIGSTQFLIVMWAFTHETLCFALALHDVMPTPTLPSPIYTYM